MREDKRRIGFDVPKLLKEELLRNIPPGTLSEISRNLLLAFLVLMREQGMSKALSALLRNEIEIKITRGPNEN